MSAAGGKYNMRSGDADMSGVVGAMLSVAKIGFLCKRLTGDFSLIGERESVLITV